jgi:protein tyrosine phosphatase (PTP) superfamily phosphohydrolase (DUF442 family)
MPKKEAIMPGKAVHGLTASAILILFAGCATPERVSSYPPLPPAPPPPNAPCNRCAANTPPPPRFTPTPAETPSNYYTPPTYTPPPSAPPAYTPPPNQGSYAPPPTARLSPPEPVAQNPPPAETPREAAKTSPPQTVEPPPASIPSRSAPLVKNEPVETPKLPVDIPLFAVVKSRVATGQQPFPDGVAWLQNEGYRTVLHLRPPGETDTAAQRVFEKRGLRYVSLEVGPRNLTKEVVEQFNKAAADESNQPLFVFDRDSSLAGPMWYLHFRTAGGMADDKAQAEAARLGFRKDQDDNARTMWIAVQNYLRNQNP